jgi:putative copper resistance protein D
MFFLVDALLLGLRAIAVLALFHAAGIALFLWLFGARLTATVEVLRRLVRAAAIIGIGTTLLEYFLLPARMAGSFGGALDPSLQALLAESTLAGAYGARFAGLALILLSLELPDRTGDWMSLAGGAVGVLSFALMGHTVVHPFRWSSALLLLAHVGAAVFWLGALVPLYAVVGGERHSCSAAIVARFSGMAVYWVPGLAFVGAVLAGLMLNSTEDLATGYGLMLMLKVAGLAVLIKLAARNKLHWTPGLVRGESAAAAGLQRSVLLEWLVIVLVVAVTVIMTSLFTPGYLADPEQTGAAYH